MFSFTTLLPFCSRTQVIVCMHEYNVHGWLTHIIITNCMYKLQISFYNALHKIVPHGENL